MSLEPFSQINNVRGITSEQERRIKDFFQGAVYCWCKNRKNEWFSVRNLMGGDNFDWHGTPMQCLYEKHIKDGKSEEDAIKSAGIDSGWILKKVICNDSRAFRTEIRELVRHYRWI